MSDSALSFTRGLFAGAIHDSLLFPYPDTLDARDPAEARTVERLVRGLRQLQRDGIIDSARFDEEEQVSEEAIRAFAELGMMGLTIPQEYGGLGLSHTAYARVFGELSAIDASLGVLIGVHCGLGAKAIALFGSSEQ
jgi:acyl-CoA dehydrogenase family protein 9